MAPNYRTLTEDDVDTIVELLAKGRTIPQLCKQYGVSDTVIGRVKYGKHQIQLRRAAVAKALAHPKPCEGCGRTFIPGCKICMARAAAEKHAALKKAAGRR